MLCIASGQVVAPVSIPSACVRSLPIRFNNSNFRVEKGSEAASLLKLEMQELTIETAVRKSTERRVRHWEHESILEEMQNRLSSAADMMRVRKRTVEHPVGTLRQWMSATHFLTRRLEGVSAEMSLKVRLRH